LLGHGALEEVAGEGRPHLTEREPGDGASHIGQRIGSRPQLADELVAGLGSQGSGEEAGGPDQGAAIQELIDVAGGRLVTRLAAAAEGLVEVLEELLPRRHAEAGANDQGGAPGSNIL